MKKDNRILIVGTDHHNTLGLIESFGERSLHPDVLLFVSKRSGYVLKSKYVARSWITVSSDEVIDIMLANFGDTQDKTVVIATSDKTAVLLDNNYDRLSPYFILPTIVRHGYLKEYMEKEYMSALARTVGLCVPQTWIISDDIIPQDIIYPCISKAISSVKGTKDNICICEDEAALRRFLSTTTHCSTLQVSQFIHKEFEFQFLGCSLDGGKEIIISGRTNIDRPNGIDNTFFLSFDKVEPELKETEEKVREFIRRTGYSGPFSVEFLHSLKDEKNYFTEMNFRNDGNAVVQTAAGINIPYIYYLYYSGGDYKKELSLSQIKQTWLMPEFYYFQCLLRKEFGVKEWWNNMRKADCYTNYFKNDKRPFAYFLLQQLKKAIKKV